MPSVEHDAARVLAALDEAVCQHQAEAPIAEQQGQFERGWRRAERANRAKEKLRQRRVDRGDVSVVDALVERVAQVRHLRCRGRVQIWVDAG